MSEASYDRSGVLETVLENSDLNVAIFDGACRVIDVSAAAAGLLGLRRSQLRGRSLLAELPEQLHESLHRALAGQSVSAEIQLPSELCAEQAWTKVTSLPLTDACGAACGGVVIVSDLSELRQASKLVERLAFIDPVTDLPNRALLSRMLADTLGGAKRRQRQLALVWLNLDRFSDVNEALGQAGGDALLRAVGERLREQVRSNDTVARLGGDDFALLLARISSRRHLETLMARVNAAFVAPFEVDGQPVFLSASCGIAVHPGAAADAHTLQENAHSAMREAKKLGGGTYEIYEAEAIEHHSARLWFAQEMREALAGGSFELHYQPLVELATMRVEAVEALARWDHPARGQISPAEFVPFAEESGLIIDLGRHLLGRACREVRGWRAGLPVAPRLAVNVSAREVQRSDVCGEVEAAAHNAGLSPAELEVEFTETAVLADPRRAAEMATRLRALGVTIALDDFGTGYSSLTHVRELPIDRVKIDRSFVGNCLNDHSAASIVTAIAHLGHDLGLEVVAEGVENEAQLAFVRRAGCDLAQGYHLARPMAPEACLKFLQDSDER